METTKWSASIRVVKSLVQNGGMYFDTLEVIRERLIEPLNKIQNQTEIIMEEKRFLIKREYGKQLSFDTYEEAKEVYDKIPNDKFLWDTAFGELLEAVTVAGEDYC